MFGITYSGIEFVFTYKTIDLNIVKYTIQAALENTSWGHLWYLYVCLGLYLILPIIKKFVEHRNQAEYIYILCILFLCGSIIPFINNLFGLSIAFQLPITCYSIFYALLGKFIHDKNCCAIKFKICAYVVVCFTVFSFISIISHNFSSLVFDENYSPLVIIYSVAVYILFKNTKRNSNSIIWIFDRLCFGVYLIHPVFIHFCYKFLKIYPTQYGNAGIACLLFWLIFALVSFAISYILSKNRFLREYIL